MSRGSVAKNTTKTPWRIDASSAGIIDFIEAPSLHTPIENVIGGPPAYLESHGIRYVPEAAPATLSADSSAAAGGLSTIEAEPAHYYTRQELDARVDTRVNQFMRESSQGLGLATRAQPLEERGGRLESSGQSTDHRLRELLHRMDTADPMASRALRAQAPPAGSGNVRARQGGLSAANRQPLSYDY
jgi:hypothetical protein